jgi:hypothetical protein
MTNKIENGKYAKNSSGSLLRVDYIDELLQDVLLCLECHRGEFYPNKDYGSSIKNNLLATSQELLLSSARQALRELDGVSVKSVLINDNSAEFTVLVNNEQRQVSFEL